MNRTTLNKIIVEYEGNRDIFVPVMVEKCMTPGTYTTYPVEIIEEADTITIKSLNKTKSYTLPLTYKEEEYILEKPGKSKCDGNCEACRKCS